MDFTDRLNTMLHTLLASGITVKTTEKALHLHAKLLISDRILAVGSVNLNKINLGFSRGAGLWRGNTETVTICCDRDVIESAKKQFFAVFDNSNFIAATLAKKIEAQVKTILKTYFDLNSRQDAKEIFARYILANEIDAKKFAIKIGRISKKLAASQQSRVVTKPILLMALILHLLSDRKHTTNQIRDKFLQLGGNVDIDEPLASLIDKNYIEQEGDCYKLNVESIL